MARSYAWEAALIEPSEPRVIDDARASIRAANAADARRVLVLDDDPTGSQAVHGVEAVMSIDPDAIERALREPGSTCFVLTNSRSLSETDATALMDELGSVAHSLETRLGGRVEIVSRSDSTLRGHLYAEIRALLDTRQRLNGATYDGVLLVPSYFEAGRFTAGDVHWARLDGENRAVGETEFARDASFGYENSDLKLLVEEKSGGRIPATEVRSIGLDDIRVGGPDRVSEILLGLEHGAFVVVNAVDYADLEVVVLGLQQAESEGRSFLYRTGPSFVRALAGIEPVLPLGADAIWPAGHPAGHGLIVVGSHVGLTNRQLDVLLSSAVVERVVLDVDALLDPERSETALEGCVATAAAALPHRDVLLVTSRLLRTGKDAEESLQIARSVSAGLVTVVGALLERRPAWVIAKGGITSHDVLVNGLGIRRAEVLGQLFAGFVSVFRPLEALPEAIGMPCVVFAGNVGDASSLATAVHVFAGDPS